MDDQRFAKPLSRSAHELAAGPLRDAILRSFNLIDNALRGRVAEAIVAHLAGGSATHDSWAPWDIDVGELKVEVKTSGDLQAWPQSRRSTRTFSIAPARAWLMSESGYEWDDELKRRSDVYVFCHHKGDRPDDLAEWDFYVVPTERIDSVCGAQRTISLPALVDRLHPTRCSADHLGRVLHELGETLSESSG